MLLAVVCESTATWPEVALVLAYGSVFLFGIIAYWKWGRR